jgi:hypothetical protein
MKSLVQAIAFGTLLLFGACVPSMNPIFTEQDLVFDQALLGRWTDPENTESWEFIYADEKEYKLVYTDEQGKKGVFKARLARIEGKTFLDLTPMRGAGEMNDFHRSHFFKTHTFVQILQKGDSYSVAYLEPQWLKDRLAKDPGAVGHLMVEGDVLLTDSTRKLQKFVLANIDAKDAFSEPTEMRRSTEPR